MKQKLEKSVTFKVALEMVDVTENTKKLLPLLEGEIPGAAVFHHVLPGGDITHFDARPKLLRVFFLICGDASFTSNENSWRIKERAVFVPHPKQGLQLTAGSDLHFLEIQWMLNEDDIKDLAGSLVNFPLMQRYVDSKQYKDYFKSDKTISRTIIAPHVLPRFCMGSVESYGFDRIEPHAHPILDQFFFSFPENNIDLLIDDQRHPLPGNTLLHIPLGSNHGAEVFEGNRMHYIWMDFFNENKGMDYIVEVHKDVAQQRSFDNEK